MGMRDGMEIAKCDTDYHSVVNGRNKVRYVSTTDGRYERGEKED